MSTCPACGHANPDTDNRCTRCGTTLREGPSTALLAPAPPGFDHDEAWQRREPEPPIGQRILVLATDSGATIALPQVPTVNLGREGLARAGMAFIDLVPYGAQAAGVSRLHARIHRLSTGYFVEDCDSTNGTFLNGIRLAAYIPQGLSSGDELQLGQLQCVVTFQPVG